MAQTGRYDRIVPWNTEDIRDGLLPFQFTQEAASLNVKAGTPVVYNSSRQLAECAASFPKLSHITYDTSANSASAGTFIQAILVKPHYLWEATLDGVLALNQLHKSYGLVKDATTGYWYVDPTNTGNQVQIVGISANWAVGDTKARVIIRFNRSACFNDNQQNLQLLSGSADAINPNTQQTYIVTRAGVDAMTLAAPTAGVDDGIIITVVSDTANAHTITATGLLQTGSASVNVATFAASKGASVTLMAYNGKWDVLSQIGITFS